MSNPWEALKRAEKVGKLVNELQKHHYTVALVERMDHADWCVVSGEAGVIPPSDESKAAVLTELRRCEQLFRPATDTQFGRIGKPQPVVALVDGLPEPWEE